MFAPVWSISPWLSLEDSEYISDIPEKKLARKLGCMVPRRSSGKVFDEMPEKDLVWERAK